MTRAELGVGVDKGFRVSHFPSTCEVTTTTLNKVQGPRYSELMSFGWRLGLCVAELA